MGMRVMTWLEGRITGWLLREPPLHGMPLCSFERIRSALRPCDVVLVEGRSRVSEVIKTITQSTWSHSALYLGCLNQIGDPAIRSRIEAHFSGDPEEPLLIEAELGSGTQVTPLSRYETHHIRICRPKGISQWDALKVIEFTVRRLGSDYDVRQVLDLARFLFPYGIIPRRWRSSLFAHNAGDPTRHVCSSMLAQAFMSVNFPILPVVQRDAHGRLRLYQRNFRLFTPRDFDHSPYFEIVKYPLVGHDDLANYRNLPWDTEGLMCNAAGDCFLPGTEPVPGMARRTLDGAGKTLRKLAKRLVKRWLGGWKLMTWGGSVPKAVGKAEPTNPPHGVSRTPRLQGGK